MTWLSNFLVSSVGRKQLMALTGLGLSGFLLVHLSGNLLIFLGPDVFNGYAAWLGAQAWLPLGRIGLITMAIVHIALAFNLTIQNSKARPTPYYHKAPSDATLASRSMIITGVLLLIYLIIHLFNFTWETNVPALGIYGVVTTKLSHPIYALFYIASMIVLAAHLSHGIQSAFQTFGINHRKHTPVLKALCIGLAIAICAGFAVIPAYLMINGGA